MGIRLRRRAPVWHVEAPIVEAGSSGRRVACRTSRGTFTLASRDLPLEPALEAFVGLLLLPALRAGARLRVEAPLDRRWREGAAKLVERWRAWWGGRPGFALEAPDADLRSGNPPRGHGLCFTTGVDSFFALFSDPDAYSHLVYAHGYDVPLQDHSRAAEIEASLDAVAAALGKQAVLLEGDARDNATFASVSWDRTHGAALAALGHVLGRHLESLTFGPSWRSDAPLPWGTHPETDPWWSTSRLAIRPGPAADTRCQRVERIADHPLVHAHLRVCWEHRSAAANCGQCEKCVRTMVALAACGVLDRCRTFEAVRDLPAAVAALPALSPGYARVWRRMLRLDLAPPLRGAIEDLVAR